MSKLVKYQLIKQKVENEHNAMSEFLTYIHKNMWHIS